MPSLLAHALKQEICMPVARLLVSVRTTPQLFKLPTGRGLKDSLQRLDERFSGSLGESPRLPQEVHRPRDLPDTLLPVLTQTLDSGALTNMEASLVDSPCRKHTALCVEST
jgi:hypothetical protein